MSAQESADSVAQQTTKEKQKKEKKSKKEKKEKGQKQEKKQKGSKYDMKALEIAIDSIQFGKRFPDYGVKGKDGKELDYRNTKDVFFAKLAKDNKDDVELLYLIAKSYYTAQWDKETGTQKQAWTEDTLHAFQYIDMAIKADPTYTPPYVLAARICEFERDKDAMKQWLERGLAVAPYDKYLSEAQLLLLSRKGRGNLDELIAELQKRKDENPNFQMEIIVARRCRDLYREIHGPEYAIKMIEWYDKVPEQMNGEDILAYTENYATVVNHIAKEENKPDVERAELVSVATKKSADMLKQAIVRYPTVSYIFYPQLLKMQSNSEDYEGAVETFQKIQESPELKDNPSYHFEVAKAYFGLKRYDDAQREAGLSESIEGATDNDKKRAEQLRDEIVLKQAKDIQEQKDYVGAYSLYEAYLNKKVANGGKITSYHRNMLGDFNYELIFNVLQGEERIPALERHMENYREMIKGDSLPGNITLAYYYLIWAASSIAYYDDSRIDLVVAPAKEAVEYIENLPEEERNSAIEARYSDACMKLFQYYSITGNIKKKEDRALIKMYGDLVLNHSKDDKDINKVKGAYEDYNKGLNINMYK